MYKRTNNNLMVAGLAGIIIVMSVFTWVMYDVAQNIVRMTALMNNMSNDVHTMAVVQEGMTVDINDMARKMTTMNDSMAVMTGSTVNMNANMARMSYDVGRSSQAFSSPMGYMRNMTPW